MSANGLQLDPFQSLTNAYRSGCPARGSSDLVSFRQPAQQQPRLHCPWTWRPTAIGLLSLLAVVGGASRLVACPFCTALANTFSDSLNSADSAVLANSLPSHRTRIGDELPRKAFRITHVLKGAEPALIGKRVEVLSRVGDVLGDTYLLLTQDDAPEEWNSPIQLTPEGVRYLLALSRVSDEGSARLRFALTFLDSDDPMVADDAYNEFARSSLDDVADLRDHLNRAWVVAQLSDADLPPHRRRLFWTLLGICGTAEDLPFVEQILQSHRSSHFEPGMDAAIACYLTLGGEPALQRVERELLADPQVDYADVYAAVVAIRVHGQEMDRFTTDRLSASMRMVLDRPQLADLVIPDLARWNDWSVMDRLIELFESADRDRTYVRVPIVRYLLACPDPAAATALERLRSIDPAAVERAQWWTFGLEQETAPNLEDAVPVVVNVPPYNPSDSSRAARPVTAVAPRELPEPSGQPTRWSAAAGLEMFRCWTTYRLLLAAGLLLFSIGIASCWKWRARVLDARRSISDR